MCAESFSKEVKRVDGSLSIGPLLNAVFSALSKEPSKVWDTTPETPTTARQPYPNKRRSPLFLVLSIRS